MEESLPFTILPFDRFTVVPGHRCLLPFYRRHWSPLPFTVLPVYHFTVVPGHRCLLPFYRFTVAPGHLFLLPFYRFTVLRARFLTGAPVSKRTTQRQHRKYLSSRHFLNRLALRLALFQFWCGMRGLPKSS